MTTRANKTRSEKRVIAASYSNSVDASTLLSIVTGIEAPVIDIMYTLCLHKLDAFHLTDASHVQQVMGDYRHCNQLDFQVPEHIWQSDDDLLGFILQSLLTEGERIETGQYYTHADIVRSMLEKLEYEDDDTFFDPCCGSGAFLLGADIKNPNNLFGLEINPIAVMVAKVNLLCKYHDIAFLPKVYCIDFLKETSTDNPNKTTELLHRKYDYIYSNPPWGADKRKLYHVPGISSKERASLFLVKSIQMLTPKGHLHFLLPTSLLKIGTHKDVRHYILHQTSIHQINLFKGRFDGVFTDFFSIKLLPCPVTHHYYKVGNNTQISLPVTSNEQTDIPLSNVHPLEMSIKNKVLQKANDTLAHSQWALGIVTGNNKKMLLDKPKKGAEPIVTGKEISPYAIRAERKFIVFTPDRFQQCAKEEYYRAPEKLIYRFIAKHPIVAYDNKQRLCLNSANILIPQVETLSVKSVSAFLNSTLYQYLYVIHCSDLKVLKGILCKLPFPSVTPEEDAAISQLVDRVLSEGLNPSLLESIDQEINRIFHITPDEQQYMKDYLSDGST